MPSTTPSNVIYACGMHRSEVCGRHLCLVQPSNFIYACGKHHSEACGRHLCLVQIFCFNLRIFFLISLTWAPAFLCTFAISLLLRCWPRLFPLKPMLINENKILPKQVNPDPVTEVPCVTYTQDVHIACRFNDHWFEMDLIWVNGHKPFNYVTTIL